LPHPLARELANFLAAQITPHVVVLGYGSGRNVPVLLAAGTRVTVIEEDPARAGLAMAHFADGQLVAVERAAYGDLDASGSLLHASFDAALSTHALLHGTPDRIGAIVAAVRERLAPGAPFFLTLGSKDDPRYGTGRRAGLDTFAPESGPEAGVPHAYFDAGGVRELMRGFALERCEESSAAETAGSWAHSASEAATLRHWFVRARRQPVEAQ
jgi:SAM-dependent methyltransferase